MVTSGSNKLYGMMLVLSMLVCGQLKGMDFFMKGMGCSEWAIPALDQPEFDDTADEIVMRISSDQEGNSFITSLEGIEKDQAIVNDAQNSSSNGYHMEKHLKMNYLKPSNTLKILKHIKQTNKFVEVTLSEVAKDRILEYLRHDTHDFRRCCFHFALYIFYGVEAGYYYRDPQDKAEYLDQNRWEVGDIIHFRECAKQAPKHFAIYLGEYDGDGICLSKLNNGGPLSVNTVESLCLMYRSPATRHYTNGPFIPLNPLIPKHLQIKHKESSLEKVESIDHPEFVEPEMVIAPPGLTPSGRRMLVKSLLLSAGILISPMIIRLCAEKKGYPIITPSGRRMLVKSLLLSAGILISSTIIRLCTEKKDSK